MGSLNMVKIQGNGKCGREVLDFEEKAGRSEGYGSVRIFQLRYWYSGNLQLKIMPVRVILLLNGFLT